MPEILGNLFKKQLDENLSEYPYETTIHGIKYLANRSRPLPDRIFWITIFVLSISSLGYFVFKIGRTWMDNPVMIIDQNNPTQIFQIPYPAVTICPQIKVKRDKFDFSNLVNILNNFTTYSEFMASNYGKKFVMASQICRRAFLKYATPKLQLTDLYDDIITDCNLSNDWMNTLQDMSPTFDEVFDTCELTSWVNNEEFNKLNSPSKTNCERLFSTVITNEGVCFTFNSIRDVLRIDSLQKDFQYHNITKERDGWDPEKGYNGKSYDAYPYRGLVKGSPLGPQGFKFVLNAILNDTTPFCFPRNVGFKIVFHSPSAYPQTHVNFIPLAYGKEYKIAAIPKTIKTNDDLRSFDPNVRQCYFNDERILKFYTFYNEENCRLECYANFSIEIHGGAPFSSPRDSNTTNRMLPHKNFGWELPEYFELHNQFYKMYGAPDNSSSGKINFTDCNCLPACNSIQYDYKIVKSHEEFSDDAGDKSTDVNVVKVQTTIEIIFNDPDFVGQKRVRMYSFVTMISDFGGLLGLFMGGSVLSLFELFYFLTIRNCFKFNRGVVADS